MDAVGPRPADPALALLAGDALRLLGRETEARAAFDVARGASPVAEVPERQRRDRGPTPSPTAELASRRAPSRPRHAVESTVPRGEPTATRAEG